ncbi:MAG: hypothetical protein RLZZ524_3162 [Pseudomonadota bacterium]|jgi:hypothetical protein
MKRILIGLAVIGAISAAVAQTNDYSNRNVRDPVQLQAKLNNDLAAVETRLDALEGSTNVNGAGVFYSVTAGAATVQTNATVGGTLAVTGVATLSASQTVFGTAAQVAAPTNAASRGLRISINGTNYWIAVYPLNT